uniref:Zinc finger CCHC domain-containing protein n=1 Tax=Esox lucius TaxID=8010 RepID=A0AAY5L8A8_ESOLU
MRKSSRIDAGRIYIFLCIIQSLAYTRKLPNALRGFDLTLGDQTQYRRCLQVCKEKAAVEPFSRFRIFPLCRLNVKVITVHMYNPYVGDDRVMAFLGRFGNVFGIWSGRRQFRVTLYKDSKGLDGLLHPLAFFSIGADQGYLFHSGQPPFCRNCWSFGHQAAGCGLLRCRNCGLTGQVIADCKEPWFCNGCGVQGQTFQDSPARRRTYAAVAGGGDGDVEDLTLRPLEEVIGKIMADKGLPAQPGTGSSRVARGQKKKRKKDRGSAVAASVGRLPIAVANHFEVLRPSLGDASLAGEVDSLRSGDWAADAKGFGGFMSGLCLRGTFLVYCRGSGGRWCVPVGKIAFVWLDGVLALWTGSGGCGLLLESRVCFCFTVWTS